MCTVTWLYDQTGYYLFSNRDEKLTRGPADPPRIFETGGLRYLAPRDPDFGGSWIVVNEAGVAACLLNGSPRQRAASRTSRGWLVMQAAGCVSCGHVAQRIASMALNQFAPFTLLILEPRVPASLIRWDGNELSTGQPEKGLLTSSSFDETGVLAARTRLFAATVPSSPEEFTAYHSSHADGPGPYSPCMHRADGATVSFTAVRVTFDHVSMTYHAGAPCRRSQPFTSHLHASLHPDRPFDIG